MRSIITVIVVLCIIFLALNIIGGVAKGIGDFFSLFPDWVWITITLTTLLSVVIRNHHNEEKQKRDYEKNLEQERKKEEESFNRTKRIEVLRDKQLNIDYKKEIIYKSPVKLIAVNNNLIAPLQYSDGTFKKDNKGNVLGSIKLKQVFVHLNDGSRIKHERFALLSAPILDLEKRIAEHSLKENSEVPGKIVIKESISPQWDGHKPQKTVISKETIGITFQDVFYPIYMRMLYMPNEDAIDQFITQAELRKIISSQREDDLPF